MFPLELILKTPGGCHSWLEERPIWEVKEVDEGIKYRNKAMFEQGLETPEMVTCLCWDKPKRNGKTVLMGFYREVLALAKEAERENTQAIINFWQEYGPLVKGSMVKGSMISIAKLKGILQFFQMITDLWEACIDHQINVIQKYLEAKPLLSQLDEFCAIFNDTSKMKYLFMSNGKPYTSAFRQGVFEKEYCLELRLPIPGSYSEEVYPYLIKRLSDNISKRLSNARLISFRLDIDGSHARLESLTSLDAGLMSLFFSTRQARLCTCGCGEKVAHGSKYASESCRLKNSRQYNEVGKLKDKCLAFYRGKKKIGIITENDYQIVKKQAGKLLTEGRELEKGLRNFCKRHNLPIWQPKVNIYRDED